MAQGEFTKKECDFIVKTTTEVFKAISKSKQASFIGHINDIYLFMNAAKAAAPEEVKK